MERQEKAKNKDRVGDMSEKGAANDEAMAHHFLLVSQDPSLDQHSSWLNTVRPRKPQEQAKGDF